MDGRELEAVQPGPGRVPEDQHDHRHAAAERHGAQSLGTHAIATPERLADLARLVATGEVELPIARTYPLERVQDAYRALADRHTHGKIVLCVATG